MLSRGKKIAVLAVLAVVVALLVASFVAGKRVETVVKTIETNSLAFAKFTQVSSERGLFSSRYVGEIKTSVKEMAKFALGEWRADIYAEESNEEATIFVVTIDFDHSPFTLLSKFGIVANVSGDFEKKVKEEIQKDLSEMKAYFEKISVDGVKQTIKISLFGDATFDIFVKNLKFDFFADKNVVDSKIDVALNDWRTFFVFNKNLQMTKFNADLKNLEIKSKYAVSSFKDLSGVVDYVKPFDIFKDENLKYFLVSTFVDKSKANSIWKIREIEVLEGNEKLVVSDIKLKESTKRENHLYANDVLNIKSLSFKNESLASDVVLNLTLEINNFNKLIDLWRNETYGISKLNKEMLNDEFMRNIDTKITISNLSFVRKDIFSKMSAFGHIKGYKDKEANREAFVNASLKFDANSSLENFVKSFPVLASFPQVFSFIKEVNGSKITSDLSFEEDTRANTTKMSINGVLIDENAKNKNANSSTNGGK